jgi:hypothetical protein
MGHLRAAAVPATETEAMAASAVAAAARTRFAHRWRKQHGSAAGAPASSREDVPTGGAAQPATTTVPSRGGGSSLGRELESASEPAPEPEPEPEPEHDTGDEPSPLPALESMLEQELSAWKHLRRGRLQHSVSSSSSSSSSFPASGGSSPGLTGSASSVVGNHLPSTGPAAYSTQRPVPAAVATRTTKPSSPAAGVHVGHGVTTSFCGHKPGVAESLESVSAQGRADAQTQALRAVEQLIAEAQAEATQLLAQAEASAMARAEEAEVLATAALSEASAAQQRAAAAAAAAQEVGPAPPRPV